MHGWSQSSKLRLVLNLCFSKINFLMLFAVVVFVFPDKYIDFILLFCSPWIVCHLSRTRCGPMSLFPRLLLSLSPFVTAVAPPLMAWCSCHQPALARLARSMVSYNFKLLNKNLYWNFMPDSSWVGIDRLSAWPISRGIRLINLHLTLMSFEHFSSVWIDLTAYHKANIKK